VQDIGLEEAIDMLSDGVDTYIIPCFMVTPREAYIKEVLKWCEQELAKVELSRIYMFIQEGITEKKSNSIWRDCQKRGATLENIDKPERLQVFCFSNIPTEIIQAFMNNAPHIEIVNIKGDPS